MAKHTGQPLERIERDTERDNFMEAVSRRELRPGRPGAREAADAESRSAPEAMWRCGRNGLAFAQDGRMAVSADRVSEVLIERRYTAVFGRRGTVSMSDDSRGKGDDGKTAVLLVLRQEPARGAQADCRPVRVHLRRVRRAVQRHHP